MMKPTNKTSKELFEYLENIPTIDAHEHLPPEEERINKKVDVLFVFFQNYTRSDFVTSGCPTETYNTFSNTEIPLHERWKKAKPYWEKIKTTSYSHAAMIALKGIYGYDNITDENIEEISQKIQSENKKGLYKKVLKDKCNIKISINHIRKVELDKEFFVPAMHVDPFTDIFNISNLRELEKKYDTPIHSLRDLENLTRKIISFWKSKGVVGLKFGHAYRRNLYFPKISYTQADKAFTKIFSSLSRWETTEHSLNGEDIDILTNYMVHICIQSAQENNLVVIFHTGLQASNYRILDNTRPERLTNLFKEYPKVKFDIFHGGLPYIDEAGIMAKYFPNVWVNMAWMHIISPEMSKIALKRWLDILPPSKIIGFGGDYHIVEKVYGHITMARINIAEVLSQMIDEDRITIKQAKTICKQLMHDSPAELYNL
ncbi:amidohydrolase family protein [Candidatus Calescamantes bacterium]|nr:amidohydrolase family protein [Candidatus Calescamantes bacterium]